MYATYPFGRPQATKREDKSVRSLILLHDNARPHIVNARKQKLDSFGWESLEHPLYGADLSLCNFQLFGLLKKTLRRKLFDDDAALVAFVCQWLQERSKKIYNDGVQNSHFLGKKVPFCK